MDKHINFPEAFGVYLDNYGFHFNKKAYNFAASLLKRKDSSTGELKPISLLHKDEVDDMLKRNGINLERNKLYDYLYVANECRADYKKSIPDEQHIAIHIKEVIDDDDASDETVFRCWLAKMRGNKQPVDFEDFL